MPFLPPIDREAALPAALGATPAAVALLAGRRRTATALLALPAALALFFRDPERSADVAEVPVDEVRAPADGRVMYVGPVQPEVAVGLDPEVDWQQVSIFLSVFNVHINRAPYAGVVESVSYRPGNWHAAYRYESAFENERSDIVVSRSVAGQQRRYVVRQIVGLLARRVVTRIEAGDTLATGERIGLMKFGSRMDVFLPPEVELSVGQGARVVAGESVIARWK
ncbi:phosphatidylserine decarboxylase [Demetria terragena]|uniref:phosphatidylserine decarboxylase n=1 Tax=Demetria terragena TaxID=63959 RepID=UPI000367393D|nr:phosphatidylserine decarboxylase [Demetria terragena]